MPLALALTIIAVLLVIIAVLSIPVIMIRRGQGIKYVYDDDPPPSAVIPGEVIDDHDADAAFFDQNDLAARKAKEERPGFVHTEILVNGIKAGPDGIVPLAEEKGFWRR